jgi:hypothetical protein
MAQQNVDLADEAPDADEMQAQVTAQNQANVGKATNAFELGNAVTAQGGNQIAQGFQQLTGDMNVGDPRVVQARKIQTAMKQIIMSANAESDPDEDPIQKQMRTAAAIAQGMAGISPQIALKAQDKLTQLQQAQEQQRYVTAEAEQKETQTGQAKWTSKIAQNTPQTIFLATDQGNDAKGIPLGFKEVNSYDLTDPDSIAKMRADRIAAAQNGQELVPMTSDQLFNSKTQVATIAARARELQSQEALSRALQVAAMKTQNGVMDGNTMRQFGRIVNAGEQSTNVLENITSLPFQGSTLGRIGIGMAPGSNLMHSSLDTLRNTLSSSDVIRYNTEVGGLQQNLATLETFGLMTRGTLVQVMDRVLAREGDTGLDRLTKLAEAKQIITNSMKTATSVFGPKMDEDSRQQVDAITQRLNAAIPFTVKDVNAWRNEGSKSKTVAQAIQERLDSEQAKNGTETPGQVKPLHGLNSTDREGKKMHWVGPGPTDYEYDE